MNNKIIKISLLMLFLFVFFGCTPQTIKPDPNQQLANQIIEKINLLPSVNELTIDKIDQVKSVRIEYDALSAEVKNKVTNIDLLVRLEARCEELIVLENENNKIQELIIEIDNLPSISDITLQDEEVILNALAKYNALSFESQNKVTNYQKLEQLLIKYNELKVEHNNNIVVAKVIEAIDLIKNFESITLSDEITIINARNIYDDLEESLKSKVTNYQKLLSAENKIKELKLEKEQKELAQPVIDLIAQLPTIGNVTLEDQPLIENARNEYNKLANEVKTKVTNIVKLTNLETKIKQLLNIEYSITLYPNDGRIEGLTKPTIYETLEFKVNYYSTGYFQVYQTDVVIMKTSLMSSSDSYQFALKIGFSYNQQANEYIVDSIVENGTGLTSNNKTSEYYIIVHAQNNLYTSLSKIEIGDTLETTVSFPTEATSTLNATIKISCKTASSSADYYLVTQKGIYQLPNPIKTGYLFGGWYTNKECTGEAVKTISKEATLYAKWIIDASQVDPNDVLNYVSDVATSNTIDSLITKIGTSTFEWTSSNPNLYVINDGVGRVSKVYQTHKKQEVKITVTETKEDGTKVEKSKNIIVNPVLYEDLPSTPVATYFSTGAMYAYKKYNERYLKNKTIFSETTKETLDIVYYAFAELDANGNCSVIDTSYLEEVKQLKNHDVRIIICINGVSTTSCQNFMTVTADPVKRANFVKNLMDMVEKYNFDGIDIDWETVSTTVKVVASQLNALMKELREEMTKRQDDGGTPYFLSAAVPASSWGTTSDRFDFVTLNKYVDYINLMAYDLNNGTKTTHLSPLYTSSNDGGYGFGCSYGIDRLVSLGLSRNKIIIGASGYGKAYKVTGTSTNTKYPYLGVAGTLTKISGIDGSFASGTLYGSAILSLIKTGRYTSYTEYNKSGQLVASYLYSSTDKIFVTYDSPEVIKAKYQYAASMNGVGIMCWCYSEDTSDSYVNAIYEEIMKNK